MLLRTARYSRMLQIPARLCNCPELKFCLINLLWKKWDAYESNAFDMHCARNTAIIMTSNRITTPTSGQCSRFCVFNPVLWPAAAIYFLQYSERQPPSCLYAGHKLSRSVGIQPVALNDRRLSCFGFAQHELFQPIAWLWLQLWCDQLAFAPWSTLLASCL